MSHLSGPWITPPIRDTVQIPYIITPVAQGTQVTLDLGQPCFSVSARNNSQFTIYIKEGAGLGGISDPSAAPIDPFSRGVVPINGSKLVTVRIDTPQTLAAQVASPSVVVFLSSVPAAYEVAPLQGSALNTIIKDLSGVTLPADMWVPASTLVKFRLSSGWIATQTDIAVLKFRDGGSTGKVFASARLFSTGSMNYFAISPNGYLSVTAGNHLYGDSGGVAATLVGFLAGTEE